MFQPTPDGLSTPRRRPTCRLFVGDSLCCLGYGIVQHADVRLWLVCNADVYLPEPKCLTGGDRKRAPAYASAPVAAAPCPLDLPASAQLPGSSSLRRVAASCRCRSSALGPRLQLHIR
jgi:hypothetical protein